MEETNYKVYKHIFPNSKCYIGITQQSLERRWQCGSGYAKRTYVRKAIDKYGWDNIKHEILFDNLTEEEACKKEIEYIKLYKSNDINYGYNIDNGGNIAGKHSILTIKKMRECKIKDKNPMYNRKPNEKQLKGLEIGRMHNKGKHLSNETKQKLSVVLKGRILSEDAIRKSAESRRGKKMSNEAKEKISIAKKGIKFSETHLENLRKHIMKKAHPIFCVETNTVYESIHDCARKLGIKYISEIERVLDCPLRKAHNYTFTSK